jgi:ribosomal protein S18 acetylase RimI-like enzyme
VSIRRARLEDEGFLLGLTTRLGAAFPVPAWRTPEEIAAADHAILLAALHQPGDATCILVAEGPAGTPAGYVFATTREDYFTHEPHAHIEVLAVEPAAEGRGIGRGLLEAVEKWAKGRGYRRMTLNVFHTNTRARALYERAGYEPETLHYHKAL